MLQAGDLSDAPALRCFDGSAYKVHLNEAALHSHRPQREGDCPVTASPDWLPEGICQEVRFFCDHWLRLKGDAALPACDLIDPLDFSHYLSRVFIVEGRSLEELQIRLAGTVYRDLYGFEITGKRITDLIPFGVRRDLLDDYTRCLQKRRPIYHTGTMNWRPRGSELSYQRILLPFGSDQGVERILGFAQFFDTEGDSVFD